MRVVFLLLLATIAVASPVLTAEAEGFEQVSLEVTDLEAPLGSPLEEQRRPEVPVHTRVWVSGRVDESDIFRPPVA